MGPQYNVQCLHEMSKLFGLTPVCVHNRGSTNEDVRGTRLKQFEQSLQAPILLLLWSGVLPFQAAPPMSRWVPHQT